MYFDAAGTKFPITDGTNPPFCVLRLPPIAGRTIFPLICKRALPAAAETGAASPKYCNGKGLFPPRFLVRLIYS